MKKILVVEDSKLLVSYIKSSVEGETGLSVDIALNSADAIRFIENNDYFAAITDLNLPDADTGYMVDVLVEKGIPTIVYTGDYNDDLRDKMWEKKIVDYVLKRDPASDKYLSKMVCQLYKNRNIDVVVVDDSLIIRNSMKRLLEAHLFRVHICKNAAEALVKTKELSNLKLVITDYMMPDMDGFEFVRTLRKDFPKDKLAVIGISGTQRETISAKFIKYGANDFIVKPFSNEQFYSRVNQNLQTILMIENILELSFKDYLTGLYNRRYFFKEMETRFNPDADKTIAMLDIDFFKKVNDTYGHDGGDEVLKAVSGVLKTYAGSESVVSRFGGEEFCIFLNESKPADYFEGLREQIENLEISFNDNLIKITCSFGVTCRSGIAVGGMLAEADELLYEAKQSGRNMVCFKS